MRYLFVSYREGSPRPQLHGGAEAHRGGGKLLQLQAAGIKHVLRVVLEMVVDGNTGNKEGGFPE
jgi:hypothetical protein